MNITLPVRTAAPTSGRTLPGTAALADELWRKWSAVRCGHEGPELGGRRSSAQRFGEAGGGPPGLGDALDRVRTGGQVVRGRPARCGCSGTGTDQVRGQSERFSRGGEREEGLLQRHQRRTAPRPVTGGTASGKVREVVVHGTTPCGKAANVSLPPLLPGSRTTTEPARATAGPYAAHWPSTRDGPPPVHHRPPAAITHRGGGRVRTRRNLPCTAEGKKAVSLSRDTEP